MKKSSHRIETDQAVQTTRSSAFQLQNGISSIGGHLTKSPERYEGMLNYLLDSSPAIIYVTSTDDRHECMYVSQNIEKLLGYKVDEAIGSKFWLSRIHPDDKNAALLQIKSNLIRGEGHTEYRFLHNNGSYRRMFDQHKVIYKNAKPVEIIGSWSVINEHRQTDAIFSEKQANLPGLINRRDFEKRIKDITGWSNNHQHVLCYLDLDQFKIINNTHGHVAGDELLRQLGKLLRENLSLRDILAYLGGDEFGIFFMNCSLDQTHRVLNKIRETLSEFRFAWNSKKHVVTVSTGIVAVDQDFNNQAGFLSAAQSACDMAKEAGRNRNHVYEAADDSMLVRQEEMLWVERINRALEEDRFLLFYQPIAPINADITEKHFELLIRMKDEDGKLVPPGLFLPAVERYNLSTAIDRWVIQTTFSWLEAYEEFLELDYSWGINLSGQSVGDETMLQFISEQLDEKQIPPNKIYFEITETAAIANLSNATNFITTLRKKGCKIALDDFGSGLSSFAYLKNLPVDFLKIDGVFVKDMADDPIDYAMVKAINDVGHAMGKQTIAEFVENDQIVEKLKEIGIDYAQGYGIAKPVSLARFADMYDQGVI